jgi:hypothetical protein
LLVRLEAHSLSWAAGWRSRIAQQRVETIRDSVFGVLVAVPGAVERERGTNPSTTQWVHPFIKELEVRSSEGAIRR